MPNSVKYNTESEANALRVGNMHIGTGDVPKGPTSTTGFYGGINPPNGGYTIYENKAASGSSMTCPTSDAELISVTNQIADTSYTTINECFNYFAGQNDKMVLANPINPIVTDDLNLCFTADILPSYPRSGDTWYDISNESNSGDLENGAAFDSDGWFDFDGVDDFIDGDGSPPLGNPCTIMALINCNSGGSGAGVIYGCAANGSDNWFEITGTTIRLFATQAADTNNFNVQGGTLICNGTRWYNVAMTLNGATAKIYLNGLEVGSTTKTFIIAGWTGAFDIGRRGKVSQMYFEGSIANVIGNSKLLSSTEILQNHYQAPIVTDGLVFAADAGNLVSYENGSVTSYSLTGSNNGTLTNGVGFDSSNGGTWTFDGVDDRIVTQASSVLGTFSDWSMDAWIKYETSGYSGWMIVVDQATYSQYQKNIMVWLSSDATNKKIAMYDGSFQYSASTIPVSTWTHISATTEGNTAKMYINGKLDVTRTFNWSNTSNVTNYMGIGSHGSNPSYKMNGNIAVVKIYDKTLTAEEVAQNYNANINRFN